ncbi:MAG: gliding motility protein GldM [Chitinophagaceae bacterium]|nr:gliding motility protein GldM [Chitinophagaceae bacterium]HEV8082615.1 gliding motility protein GldM [Chitinophagaceae bacterium]
MALPREPRQKMINIMYLVLTAILALNVSNEVINAFRVVNTSLITSNENITSSNETIYKSLGDKLANPQSHDKAVIWEPKAMAAKKYSESLSSYIESLKYDLKKGADLKMRWDKVKKDSVEDYRMDNLDASTRLFETNGKGKDLEARLQKYKQDMLNIDPSIKAQFEATFPVNIKPPLSQDGTEKDFTQSFFHMTPTIAALTMLSKFQNNVKNAESEIVTYCHNQIGAVEVHMDQVGVLVGQNSNYLMPGQELQITAGVGAYSSAAAPTISINGSNVNVSNGQGTYTTTVSGGSGERTVNVNVSFRDENNKIQTKSMPVKYTVGTPGGAAVMLDKMNVFYIGVPNPVTISSGTGWDKTHVSMTSGSLSSAGGTGKYIVNVSAVGKTTINVNADGKNSSYDFRIKRIPDPILKVGPSSGGRIQSVVFKNQQFARADLENFDFDARFSVVSATVYFSGANFPSVQSATISGGNLGGISAQLQKCIPGSSVNFDNVKVQGPDKVVRSIPGPGFLLY